MLKFAAAATLLFAAVTASAPASAAGVEALKWKARPVIVFEGEGRNAADQIGRLERDRAALDAREMSVFVVGPTGVTTLAGGRAPSGFSAERLRKTYGVAQNDFTIVLIGKDGGEKLRSTVPVDASRLIDLVDAMPMRRNEAR